MTFAFLCVRQLVEMALDLLGLEHCRHFVCDPAIGERLSGGQMRRVGIGVGVLPRQLE